MMRTRLMTMAGAMAITAVSGVTAASDFAPGTVPGTFKGPTSSQTPYVVPAAAGWEVISVLTVGDSATEVPYRMVGIPDGLGAMAGREEKGKYTADKAFMTVFMHHELNNAGAIRAHGAIGAFVSQWTIQLNTLSVKWGQDLIERLYVWNGSQYTLANGTAAAQLSRLCSADLPGEHAFFNPRTGAGFNGRLFMGGEEAGNEGRAFATIVTGANKGTAYDLPYLGNMSWENVVAHPNAGDRTIVVGLDDSTPGQVYVYVGTKQFAGSPIAQAGLEGGRLYGVKVAGTTRENAGPLGGVFSLAEIPGANNLTGAQIQSMSVSAGITEFARPEDGFWDPSNPAAFYFVTTGATIDGAPQSSRLYKLTFNSLANPTGGLIELVVDRAGLTPAPPANTAMFDNITVNQDGLVLIQEDPGGNAYLARTWIVDPSAPPATRAHAILLSDAARFAAGPPNGLTTDEESSGIIEVTDIVSNANWFEAGRRYYLADMQAHYGLPSPLVEGGQLYLVASPKP